MAIAQVGGGNNNSATGTATSLAVTYSPTSGNVVVVFVNTAVAVTGLTVKDSANNVLTAGPVQGNLACFYQVNVPASITSYTASWTTGSQVGMALEEYSGAAAVNANFSANHASGTSASASIVTAIVAVNNWIVAGLASANTITGSVGNQRQQVAASTAQVTLMDNTSASIGNVTCTGTLTSAAWAAVSIELGGTGKARADQDVILVIKQPTSSKARVAQDLLLSINAVTSSKARVAQDLLLVVDKGTPSARVSQDVILVISASRKIALVSQDVLLVIVKNAPLIQVQPFCFVMC